ncbi:hypothetical protein ONZ45_g7430 [Pleurotus djamor]|nr:hypothetical protein ONZ45_g7430 [Pleurotus djamor]
MKVIPAQITHVGRSYSNHHGPLLLARDPPTLPWKAVNVSTVKCLMHNGFPPFRYSLLSQALCCFYLALNANTVLIPAFAHGCHVDPVS